jgi:hypothetical protein
MELWIYLVVGYRDIIRARWRNLDLPCESCISFVAFALGSGGPNLIGASLCSIFDLVEALFFTVEPLYLYHIKGISDQVGLNSHIEWAVTT